jgi:hypothetical protein
MCISRQHEYGSLNKGKVIKQAVVSPQYFLQWSPSSFGKEITPLRLTNNTYALKVQRGGTNL